MKRKATIADLMKSLTDFEATPEGYAMGLLLDVQEIVLRGMKRMGWTQADLSEVSGVSAPTIHKIVYAIGKPTIDTISKLFHALGVKVKLEEK